MAWLYLYSTGSTEARLRSTFTTAYNRGNIKMYQKRIIKYTAKTVGNGIPNLLGKNMKPLVKRHILMPMFEDKNMKDITQKMNTKKRR